MNVKYIKISRKCRHHVYHDLGAAVGCFFCKRADDHNKYNKISPEEVLISQIFQDGRVIKRIANHSSNYKGKPPHYNRS